MQIIIYLYVYRIYLSYFMLKELDLMMMMTTWMSMMGRRRVTCTAELDLMMMMITWMSMITGRVTCTASSLGKIQMGFLNANKKSYWKILSFPI